MKNDQKKFHISNPLKNDPFLKSALTWALGIVSFTLVLNFAALQMAETEKGLVELIPFLFVIFGAGYLVKFIGERPAFYSGVCGFAVGMGLAFVGLVNELLNGLYWESFARFLWAGVARGVPLAIAGAIAGWVVTRGRVAVEIEVPGKKDIEAAKKSGMPEPSARIITPITELPGSVSNNKSLLEQLDSDPVSLLPEKERKRREKAGK